MPSLNQFSALRRLQVAWAQCRPDCATAGTRCRPLVPSRHDMLTQRGRSNFKGVDSGCLDGKEMCDGIMSLDMVSGIQASCVYWLCHSAQAIMSSAHATLNNTWEPIFQSPSFRYTAVLHVFANSIYIWDYDRGGTVIFIWPGRTIILVWTSWTLGLDPALSTIQ